MPSYTPSKTIPGRDDVEYDYRELAKLYQHAKDLCAFCRIVESRASDTHRPST
jgi:hypothetical protein